MASRNSADAHLQNILECTYGIIFLGTPHSGSGLARWAQLSAKSIGLIKETNPKILEVLRADSEVLARIQADFHTMMRSRANNGHRPIAITCFYEELPLVGIGEVSIAVRAMFLLFDTPTSSLSEQLFLYHRGDLATLALCSLPPLYNH